MTCQQARKLLEDGVSRRRNAVAGGSDPALAKETVLGQPAQAKYPTPSPVPTPAHRTRFRRAITDDIDWENVIVYELDTYPGAPLSRRSFYRH